VLGAVREKRPFTPCVGWVGDVFDGKAREAAELLDAVAYTDTGMVELHATLGLPGVALYLPHAANPKMSVAAPAQDRRNRMVFIAIPSDRRRALVKALRSPITIYGPQWTQASDVAHEIVARRISLLEVAGIYGRHMASLNIANEINVVHGLNQRNFDPYLVGTAVVAEAQPDLEACFEPGLEVLAYSGADGLNEVHERLLADPGLAAAVGRRGQARVLAEHTYGRRLEQLMWRLSGAGAGRQAAPLDLVHAH
ncbi:MAG TPA: glycosyltransferase, partial [Caulobacteraceae bacterium]|nr:glycosyltransferase [Caulobacteraceae bacterium]